MGVRGAAVPRGGRTMPRMEYADNRDCVAGSRLSCRERAPAGRCSGVCSSSMTRPRAFGSHARQASVSCVRRARTGARNAPRGATSGEADPCECLGKDRTGFLGQLRRGTLEEQHAASGWAGRGKGNGRFRDGQVPTRRFAVTTSRTRDALSGQPEAAVAELRLRRLLVTSGRRSPGPHRGPAPCPRGARYRRR